MIKDWFVHKTEIEQKIILVLTAISTLMLIYAFLYLPIQRENQRLKLQNIAINHDVEEMLALETKLHGFSKHSPVKRLTLNSSQLLMRNIQDIAKQQNISTPKISSQGKDKIVVQLSQVDFNASMRWLGLLKKEYQVNIGNLLIEQKTKGMVNLKLVINLSRTV